MQEKGLLQQRKEQQEQILFVTALDLFEGRRTSDTSNQRESDGKGYSTLFKNPITTANSSLKNKTSNNEKVIHNSEPAAILRLRFPFELMPDQVRAVEAWLSNKCRGSIIYGSGTGKTEIAFECARRAVATKRSCSRVEDSITWNDNDINSSTNIQGSFKILMLVPRIVLVEQNYKRLISYGIPAEKIGRYFGEQKEIREITISTYHSAIYNNKRNLDVIRRANMVVFDEVHLASATARTFSRIFDVVAEDKDKALLGLTATIDEHDPANSTIMALLPPVRKYLIKDAVEDRRLARPIIFPLKVTLTSKEQREYHKYSKSIKTISARFKRYDPKAMMELLRKSGGGFQRWQARAWFLNVRKRKSLLASAHNKLANAVELIKTKHSNQKIMVFSETLESIRKLKQLLEIEGIDSAIIDSKIPSVKRQKMLSQWGSKFYPLLSVHTLEIGYDVPEAGVEIILASTSNMNQIVQRIGRVLRKVQGKDSALVYVIYVSETRDNNIMELVKKAIESSGGTQDAKREEKDKLLQQQDRLADNQNSFD